MYLHLKHAWQPAGEEKEEAGERETWRRKRDMAEECCEREAESAAEEYWRTGHSERHGAGLAVMVANGIPGLQHRKPAEATFRREAESCMSPALTPYRKPSHTPTQGAVFSAAGDTPTGEPLFPWRQQRCSGRH